MKSWNTNQWLYIHIIQITFVQINIDFGSAPWNFPQGYKNFQVILSFMSPETLSTKLYELNPRYDVLYNILMYVKVGRTLITILKQPKAQQGDLSDTEMRNTSETKSVIYRVYTTSYTLNHLTQIRVSSGIYSIRKTVLLVVVACFRRDPDRIHTRAPIANFEVKMHHGMKIFYIGAEYSSILVMIYALGTMLVVLYHSINCMWQAMCTCWHLWNYRCFQNNTLLRILYLSSCDLLDIFTVNTQYNNHKRTYRLFCGNTYPNGVI